jgi:hypothetical protein
MRADPNIVKLNLRLVDTLHLRLTAAAKRSERSLQREIIFRLRSTFEDMAPNRRSSRPRIRGEAA